MIKVDNKVLCENCFAETDRIPCPECGFDGNGYAGDLMTLKPGSILAGRYAVGGVMGQGGFGITYLAYDLKLGCKVEVKEYYPYGLAARLPGSTRIVVTGQDFFYENNTVYLTMSYLDGRTPCATLWRRLMGEMSCTGISRRIISWYAGTEPLNCWILVRQDRCWRRAPKAFPLF